MVFLAVLPRLMEKTGATLGHDAQGTGQPRSSDNTKWHAKGQTQGNDADYYLMPALRVTLTSTESKPCIYQMALPVGAGESTAFRILLDELDKAYGRSDMYKIIDGDATVYFA